jgi:hypothetical protein
MEILAGFSIGPRPTPCPRLKSPQEMAEIRSFFKSKRNSGFRILCSGKKICPISDIEVFEKQQPRNTSLTIEGEQSKGQREKELNRKLVQDSGQKTLSALMLSGSFILQILK